LPKIRTFSSMFVGNPAMVLWSIGSFFKNRRARVKLQAS
jgi:hypothetical protein